MRGVGPRLSSALAPRPTACPIDKLLTDNHTDLTDRRRTMIKRYTGLIACALLFAAIRSPALAGPAEEARQHVDMAQATLSNFLRDPNMSWIQANLANAKGVLIVPKVVKVGFVFGGSGGRGVL